MKKIIVTGCLLLAIAAIVIYISLHLFDKSSQPPPEQKAELKTRADSIQNEATKAAETALKQDEAEKLAQTKQLTNLGFKDFELFHLNEPLTADFNGDKVPDVATFVRKGGDTTIILITDGKTKQPTNFGDGNHYIMSTNFAWASYWGVVQPQTTFEEMVKSGSVLGEYKIKLLLPSIIIRKEDGSGGIITYRFGEYSWVHQSTLVTTGEF